MTKLSLRLEALDDPDPWIYQRTVYDILDEYLQPDSATNVKAAAEKINKALLDEKISNDKNEDGDEAYDKDHKGNDDEDKHEKETEDIQEFDNLIIEIWEIIIELTKQIPHDNIAIFKIVHLIKNLTLLPATTLNISNSKRQIWKGAPLLWTSLRDAWIRPREKTGSKKTFEAWVSLNALAATLFNSGLIDATSFAIWAMRDALETPKPDSNAYWECLIAAAAQWIQRSAHTLWDNIPEIMKGPSLKAGELYREDVTYRKARWIFWKSKFEALATDITSTDDVKLMAKSAADLMHGVEDQAIDSDLQEVKTTAEGSKSGDAAAE